MLDHTDMSQQQALLTISQVAEMLGLGRTKVHELIAAEGLPVIRFGRSVRISPVKLQQWLEEREQRSRFV